MYMKFTLWNVWSPKLQLQLALFRKGRFDVWRRAIFVKGCFYQGPLSLATVKPFGRGRHLDWSLVYHGDHGSRWAIDKVVRLTMNRYLSTIAYRCLRPAVCWAAGRSLSIWARRHDSDTDSTCSSDGVGLTSLSKGWRKGLDKSSYCYTLSSVVSLSVCLLGTFISLARTAEPIEMPFGRYLRWAPRERGKFEGESGGPF